MSMRESDRAEQLIARGLDVAILEAVGARRGVSKQRARSRLRQLRPLLLLLARAAHLRVAALDAPNALDVDLAGRAVVEALLERLGVGNPLADLLHKQHHYLLSWGYRLARLAAENLRELQSGPQRTPGTRLLWSNLGEWLAARRRLDRRPPSSAKNAAWVEHHRALSQAIVNTGTAKELAELQTLAAREHNAAWQDWIHLAGQDIPGRVRKLAQALRLAAGQRLPRLVTCAELASAGYPSVDAATRIGTRRLDDIQRLLSPDLHVDYEPSTCAFSISRAKTDCGCARCATAR